VVGEDQVEESHDFVELSLKVKGTDTSLTEAIEQAKKVIKEIENVAEGLCVEHGSKQACEQIVEAG
jgi:hypothetical protein